MLIVFAVFVSACQLQPQAPGKEQQLFGKITGSEGLRISFLENLPPPRLFDNEEFNALLQIENKGTANVDGTYNKIYLSGFDPAVLNGISNFGMQIPALRGKDIITQQEDIGSVSFVGRIALLKDLGMMQTSLKLLATACYAYETLAGPEVCIDPTPFSPALRQKVCKAQSVSAGTQGAPVAVTSVDVLASPGSTKFKVYVKNVGGGRVFRSGLSALSKCAPSAPWADYFKDSDYVEVQDVLISGFSIKNNCMGLYDNHVRLKDGQGVFFCEFNNIRSSSAYPAQLVVKLRYGYETTLLKNVDVYSSS